MKERKRLEEIDILKALGIISMVFTHSGAPGTEFVALFHMAIFLMASGYVYSSRHSDSFDAVVKSVKSKIVRLWFPYFLWTTIFIFLNNLFLKINIYTDNPGIFEYIEGTARGNLTYLQHYMDLPEMLRKTGRAVFFINNAPISGALWFLGALLFISGGYVVVDWLIRRFFRRDPIVIQTVVSFLLLALGRCCSLNDIMAFGLNRVFTCYIMYHIGHCFKRFNVLELLKTKAQYLWTCGISLVILLVIYQFYPHYGINLWENTYPNIVILLTASLAGWGLVYSISHFLKSTPLKNALLFIGSRTMCVMILHFLFFKLVALVIVQVYGLPEYCMAAHTHLYGDRGLWWLAYTVVGLAGPILVYEIYKKVQKKIVLKISKRACV